MARADGVAIPDRLTTSDVAVLAGVTPSAIRLYKSRQRMPMPGTDGLWDRATIVAWAAQPRPQGRQPRTVVDSPDAPPGSPRAARSPAGK